MRFAFPACLYISCTAFGRRSRLRLESGEHRMYDGDYDLSEPGPYEHYYVSPAESKERQSNWESEVLDRCRKAFAMLVLGDGRPSAAFQLPIQPLPMPAAREDQKPPIAVQHSAVSPLRLERSPRLMQEYDKEAERKKRLKQLFGEDFRTPEEEELARATDLEQPVRVEDPTPEWAKPRPDGLQSKREWDAKRLTFWLEDSGVEMDAVNVTLADERRLELRTARAVPAGTVLFDVPGNLVLTAEAAFADAEVGEDLRTYVTKSSPGSGFDVFAIATLLGAERVRRGAVSGKLRRVEGGLLPKWEEEEREEIQSNFEFSPLVASLDWPLPEELVVDEEKVEAVRKGAEFIAKLIDPVARNAWFVNSFGKGLVQPTSTENVPLRALEALVLAMNVQVNPPPPLGEPDGEARWGGDVWNGPALCPLVNLVLPPSERIDEARDAGEFNAILGRPIPDSDIAIRCIASRDLPAGAVILSDVPGNGDVPVKRNGVTIAPGSRVRVVGGALLGQMGTVVLVRKDNGKPLVRLEGGSKKPVILPASSVELVN